MPRPKHVEIVLATSADPTPENVARALLLARWTVVERVGRQPLHCHMGDGSIDCDGWTPGHALLVGVARDLEYYGRALLTIAWGEGDDFDQIVAVAPAGGGVAVMWLGEHEHALVLAARGHLLRVTPAPENKS